MGCLVVVSHTKEEHEVKMKVCDMKFQFLFWECSERERHTSTLYMLLWANAVLVNYVHVTTLYITNTHYKYNC